MATKVLIGFSDYPRVDHASYLAYQRQRREDHHHHQDLGEFQRAGDGVVQQLAPEHIRQGQPHDGEQCHCGQQAAEAIEQPLHFCSLAISAR